MKKILLGILVAGAVGGVAMLATNAFFSDTETSTGNTFTAGSLDLKISDTCHYYKDGIDTHCANILGPNGEPIVLNWTQAEQGAHKFFYFTDVKPGDYGENTVDFKVINNPAWMCAKLNVTTQYSNLQKYLTFVWWVDTDGNNILNDGEKVLFSPTPLTLQQLLLGGNLVNLTFADSWLNWTTWPGPTPPNTTPIPGNLTQYLGIGWCFGNMVLTPGSGIGFTCSGIGDQNDAQGTSVVADLSFNVEQFRNNPTFRCPENIGKPR